MGKEIFYILVVIVVILGVSVLAYEKGNINPVQYSEQVYSLVQNHPDGSFAEFFLDPQKPVTEYVYKMVEKKEIVTLDNGTQVEQVTQEQVAVPVSEGEITTTEKQSLQKYCRVNYQCIIEGKLGLVDNNGKEVPPPYFYVLTITCDFRDGCNAKREVSITGEKTDGNGGFRYTWTTSANLGETAGEYNAIVSARSTYKTQQCDDFGCSDRYITYDFILPIQLT